MSCSHPILSICYTVLIYIRKGRMLLGVGRTGAIIMNSRVGLRRAEGRIFIRLTNGSVKGKLSLKLPEPFYKPDGGV